MATMHPNPLPEMPGSVRITDPGDLLAAIPAMLGFCPERSLVVIGFAAVGDGGRCAVRAVMRHDLPDSGIGPPDLEPLYRIAGVCGREDFEFAVAVVIDEDESAGARRMHAYLLEVLWDFLSEHDVPLRESFELAALEAGSPWRGRRGDDGSHGVLPDPGASQLAATLVFEGRVIHPTRADLADVLRPDDVEDRRRLALLLARARADSEPTSRPGAPAGSPAGEVSDELARVLFESVLTAIARAESGEEFADRELVEIALALGVPTVRDALLGLALTEEAAAAERMWLRLARALPPPDCAEAATMFGFSAYTRGDGPLAGIALAEALGAHPGHRLARLLDEAMQRGVRPEAVTDLARTGLEVADRLGVTLPPVS